MSIRRAISGGTITVSYDRAAVLIGSGVIGMMFAGADICATGGGRGCTHAARNRTSSQEAQSGRRKRKRRDQMPTVTRSCVKFVRVASKFRYFA